MRLLCILVPIALVGLSARRAQAEEGEFDHPLPSLLAVESRPAPVAEPPSASLALEPSVGLGTPLGYLGASVVVYPIHVVALHAGAGLGHQGPQIEAGARYRVAMAKNLYLSPGLSWSTGSYATGASDVNNTSASSQIFYWDRAHFANTTLGLEVRARSVAARPFIGLGYAFGKEISANRICPERGCSAEFANRVLLFVGFAVSFDLF